MKHPFIFILILFFACKKNEDPGMPPSTPLDTIKPNPYFPVYPGSWWKYSSNKGDTSTTASGKEYVMDYYWYEDDTKRKRIYAAMIAGYGGRKIWGRREKVTWSTVSPKLFIPVVSDSLTVGAGWETGRSNSQNYTVAGIKTKDTAIIIAGKTYSPVIVVDHSYAGLFNPVKRYAIEYYAKDIGLVKRENFHYTNPDSVISYIEITSYFINR